MISEVEIHWYLTNDEKEWIITSKDVREQSREGVSGAIKSTRIRASAMAKLDTPQWDEPMVGSLQDSTKWWFTIWMNYWYCCGGVEAMLMEVWISRRGWAENGAVGVVLPRRGKLMVLSGKMDLGGQRGTVRKLRVSSTTLNRGSPLVPV